MKFFPSLGPFSYNLYHRDPPTYKSFNMNSWVLSDTFASLDNDMDHSHVPYIYHTMVLLLAKGLVLLFPCTARKLGTHSSGVLLSYMWYTKQLLCSLFPDSDQARMLDSSGPPSIPLLSDLSYDTGSLPVVRLPAEPLPKFGTFVVSMGISNVVVVNSQRYVYATCRS
jgi:hypothetical protein